MTEKNETVGDFIKEEEAAEFFDTFSDNPFFTFESEVKGRRLFDEKPVDSEKNGQNAVIDRLLHPNWTAVYDYNWKWGSIGVEIKKSGIRVAPVLAQVMEQRQTLFRSHRLGNNRIMPIVFSVFPCTRYGGDLESFLTNQAVLSCIYDFRNKSLKFQDGSMNVLQFSQNFLKVNTNWKPSTRKGHRSNK